MREGSAYIHGPETSLNEVIAAAHELKTPLTIIAHLAAAIEDPSLELTPAEQTVAIRRIKLSAERTLRLVQGLTVSHRLAHNDQLAFQFALEPLNATQICEEVIHEITPLAKQYDQQVQFTSSLKPQLVVGNAEFLHSIFFNLIDNAIRHNPPQTAVTVRVRRRDELVRVCVQDNGPGLAGRDLQRLRQTIGTELQPLHGRSGNSGLGLYIASTMAKAMGGKLGLGHMQAGADFHVDLQYSKQLSFL